ncbi:hypothetical protein Pmar_PMAR000830 [Perkinsus marinus ATCC 50983]|uniref:EF-hand domain-containing protein n=1 Tax=Perkinsus marinus (strain ATCC 50983 / TXsc) TaxID=423536 RepID=C5KXR2_PERM5|nr:hypothetical protein Pmar_PMAR000830 [Perkinsus marinus ATCC 50983]EER10786.1 hypothetical protein Pmar_PMAR000830 [Perkinsus marinus ATCC 50983]|eukprot:XP_002778991.1 hypothetical protein Pmar_PMAR000830 [Perkinsus marinus ATCC 50983]
MSRPSNPFAQGFRRVDLEGGAQSVVSTVVAWKAQATQMSMTMDIIFFTAACCVVVASVISTIEVNISTNTTPSRIPRQVFLTEIAPFDLVDCVYLLLFGTKMMLLDAPVRFKGIVEVQVRQQIRRQNANTEQMFNSYARSNFQEGMTADEFNLLSQVAGISFRNDELTFVLNALCNDGRLGISQRDFCGWINGPAVLL